jgi:hypothetical protein
VTIGEVAGYGALAAIGSLLLSAVAIALFFGGAGDFWGPINDLFVSLTLILLIPVIVAVLRLAPDDIGPWFAVVCVAAIAGALLGAIGQVLLVVGVIDLQASFVTGGIGVAPILLWAAALAYLVFTRDMLSVLVGWTLLAILISAAAVTVTSMAGSWGLTTVLSVVMLAAFIAWLALLSSELRAAI